MKKYYLIKTTDNERSSSYKYITDSFEEAEQQVNNFADWWCNNGTCTLVTVNQLMRSIERRTYRDGELVEHRVKTIPNDDRTWKTVFTKYR